MLLRVQWRHDRRRHSAKAPRSFTPSCWLLCWLPLQSILLNLLGQKTGIKSLSLLHDPPNHLHQRTSKLRLDKPRKRKTAPHLRISSEVQSFDRRSKRRKSQLSGLFLFNAVLLSSNAISHSEIYPHGRVDVSLQSPGHVVEASWKSDYGAAHLSNSWYELDALGDLLPCRV